MNIGLVGQNCVGCRSCMLKCPLGCISFAENGEGFLYPHVDEKCCMQCGACTAACPALHSYRNNKPQECFAAWTTDREILMKSSSGGVFSTLAEDLIQKGAVICGCTCSEKSMPFHSFAQSKEELQPMRGSKYVQSSIGDAYQRVRKHLDEGRGVLFAGTPCQVAGLYRFLGSAYDLLYTVDIICHGVPSRPLFASYINWLEKRYGGKISGYRFRSKDRHAWSLTEQFYINSPGGRIHKVERMASLSPYYYGFLKGMFYRECCYQCLYANMTRPGDITLGDFWGVEEVDAMHYNPDGVSAVLVNNEKGARLIENVRFMLNLGEVSPNQISLHNGNLLHPTSRPKERNEIYAAWRERGFDWLAKHYLNNPDRMRDLIKNIIPNRTRQIVKQMVKDHLPERITNV